MEKRPVNDLITTIRFELLKNICLNTVTCILSLTTAWATIFLICQKKVVGAAGLSRIT